MISATASAAPTSWKCTSVIVVPCTIASASAKVLKTFFEKFIISSVILGCSIDSNNSINSMYFIEA